MSQWKQHNERINTTQTVMEEQSSSRTNRLRHHVFSGSGNRQGDSFQTTIAGSQTASSLFSFFNRGLLRQPGKKQERLPIELTQYLLNERTYAMILQCVSFFPPIRGLFFACFRPSHRISKLSCCCNKGLPFIAGRVSSAHNPRFSSNEVGRQSSPG